MTKSLNHSAVESLTSLRIPLLLLVIVCLPSPRLIALNAQPESQTELLTSAGSALQSNTLELSTDTKPIDQIEDPDNLIKNESKPTTHNEEFLKPADLLDNKTSDKKSWLFLHPYNASYTINADGENLGNASRVMSRKGGTWKLEIATKLKKWMLTLRSREVTEFTLKNSQINSQAFLSSSKLSFKKDRVTKQDFNWQTGIETGKRGDKRWTLPLESQVFDRMNHLIQLRADLIHKQSSFDYSVSYKGKRTTYSYHQEKLETVNTPFGKFKAVKLVRTSGDDSSFAIWMSPDLNYFPIKIAQFEQDKPDVVLVLRNLEFLNNELDAKNH